MRYLITGGAGFIGTAMSRRLLADGHHVTILDVIKPGIGHDRLGFVYADVRDRLAVQAHADVSDIVLHLASKVGVRHYLGQTSETIDIIVSGSHSVLQACSATDTPLLLLSTSEAYGKGTVPPMREDDDLVYGSTDRSRWVYGMAKALSEHQALDMHRRTGLPVTIVRPFNIVGAGQSAEGGLVFPSFARAVATGSPIVVHGDGRQTRSFCHVEDFIDGVLRLLATPEAHGQVINLGSDDECTIREVAERFQAIASEFGPAPVIERRGHAEVYGACFEDTRWRVPDLSRAKALIGWEPTSLTPLDTIIRETLAAVLPLTARG